MENKRFFLIFCIVFFLFTSLYADDKNDADVRKVCVFDIQQIQEKKNNSEGEIFTEVIKNTLVFELKVAGFEIIDDDVWKQIKKKEKYSDEDILEGPKAVDLAGAAKADVAINGFFSVDEKRILFGIKCYDVRSRRLAASILKSGRAGVSATSLINDAIEEIIPKISEELAVYSTNGDTIEQEKIIQEDISFKEMIELGTKIKVTFKSPDEDADIYLADTHIGKIQNGELSFESKASSVIQVKVEKSHFHPQVCEFELGEEDGIINLPGLQKVNKLAFEAQYTLFQTIGLGLGVRYYFIPDWLFVGVNCYTYLQAGYLPGSNSVLHFDNNLSIGYYIYFSPSSIFRAGIYMGFGWIPSVVLAEDGPAANDFYWDIFGGWIELNLKDFIIYFKEVGRFNQDIFGTGFLETGWAEPIPAVMSIGVLWKW